jgi:endogenous inhibitor of DNA gyrase (YacG/DUF329 family)
MAGEPMKKKYFRNCPKCNKEISYVSERNFIKANKSQQICISCAKNKNIPLTRACPQCGELVVYTNKNNRQTAEKRKSLCVKCAGLNRDFNGENNPFFGRKHSEKTKDLISNYFSNVHVYTDAQKEQARNQLAKVFNDQPLYDIWLEKYGQEEANRRLIEFKKKQSENNSGSGNPMFGKPSPQGSGNGWSGWYKGWYFRSLRELSYMIKVLETQKLNWEIPDKKYKIPYVDYAGQIRTYFPDFIVDTNKLVEIKPTKLHNTPKVLAKRKAAEDFCQSQDMSYELIDPPILSQEEIKQLYISGQIKFLERYDKKFRERYLVC